MHTTENTFLTLTRKHFEYVETEYDFTVVECTPNDLEGGRVVYQNAHTDT